MVLVIVVVISIVSVVWLGVGQRGFLVSLLCVDFIDLVFELLYGGIELGLKFSFGFVGLFAYFTAGFCADFSNEFRLDLFDVGGVVEIREILIVYSV